MVVDAFVIEGSDFGSHLEAAAAVRNFVRDWNRRARHRMEELPPAQRLREAVLVSARIRSVPDSF